MLENILYLLQETVLPGYLALLSVQVLFLFIAIRKQNLVWWILTYVLDGISILTAFAGMIYFWESGTLSHLADTIFSIGALWVFILKFCISLSIRINSKRDG